MSIEQRKFDESETGTVERVDLIRQGMESLAPFLDKIDDLYTALDKLAELGDEGTEKSARRMQHQLAVMEPSITMIGQVKAGKTSLVNAMVGWPSLLPADVNPWTSVVTSLHLNPYAEPSENCASFRFFEQEEWSKLVDRGGRIGELASRAGANEEMEKVRRQVEEMRAKSQRRLGRKFELLLGQEHNYGYFDADLIERYVCLGDDFEDEIEFSNTQGRFADITKSADLFLSRKMIPMPLCIRDTPGVNDTFMMREQITIRAIRESRICVVVLSAHQALSSVDMALIRLIANVKSREVIIFVNRIDELSDPANQVPEIRASIEQTLREQQGPDNVQIIFGSALWATAALTETVGRIPPSSADALMNWSQVQKLERDDLDADEVVWHNSGVPALFRAISERVEEGLGREIIDRIARSAINLANGLRASGDIILTLAEGSAGAMMSKAAVLDELDRIAAKSTTTLERRFDAIVEDFDRRLDRAQSNFLDRATASLLKHLESRGEGQIWEYDPSGFRLLLRSAYQVFSKKSVSGAQEVFDSTADELSALYLKAFKLSNRGFRVEAPTSPRVPPPVLLGQTIALDLKGNWWSRWWHRRRGYQAFAMEFGELIRAEIAPIIAGLQVSHAGSLKENASRILAEFIEEQRAILTSMSDQADMNSDDLDDLLGLKASKAREESLDATMATLSGLAA